MRCAAGHRNVEARPSGRLVCHLFARFLLGRRGWSARFAGEPPLRCRDAGTWPSRLACVCIDELGEIPLITPRVGHVYRPLSIGWIGDFVHGRRAMLDRLFPRRIGSLDKDMQAGAAGHKITGGLTHLDDTALNSSKAARKHASRAYF